jgi:hypothetical protein
MIGLQAAGVFDHLGSRHVGASVHATRPLRERLVLLHRFLRIAHPRDTAARRALRAGGALARRVLLAAARAKHERARTLRVDHPITTLRPDAMPGRRYRKATRVEGRGRREGMVWVGRPHGGGLHIRSGHGHIRERRRHTPSVRHPHGSGIIHRVSGLHAQFGREEAQRPNGEGCGARDCAHTKFDRMSNNTRE